MTATYDIRLVILSFAIAVFASYTALNLVSQISTAQNRLRSLCLAAGAVAMGIGIWSMHFIAILAYKLPFSTLYNLPMVAWSLLVAIAASGSALFIASRRDKLFNLIVGGVLLGVGADAMQYSGIAAMRLEGTMRYNLAIVMASILFASCTSIAALGLVFRTRTAALLIGSLRVIGSSVIMGTAICGMHYTAMEAVSFQPTHLLSKVSTYEMNTAHLATIVGMITLVILILALIASHILEQFNFQLAAKAEALQESEELFRSLFQNISNIIATIGADGKITYVSPSITQILGYNPEAWISKNMIELVYPDDQSAAEDLLCCIFYNPLLDFKAEFRLQNTAGCWRTFEATARNLLDDPNVAGIVITYRDITEQKQAEAEVNKALEKERELNELKSRFMSMASHEFRTPLSVISSSIGILEDYGHRLTEEQQRRQFQCLRRSIDSITHLLDDVLTLNRVDLGKLEFKPVELNIIQFCQDLVEEMQLSGPQYLIEFSSIDQRQQANSSGLLDEKLLQRILTNLLSNAIKYSHPGSTVQFKLVCQDDRVIFQIEDEGIGIPNEEQNHLFEAFYRAKNVNHISGTGLGLSIVRKCVDLHGGKIAVQSQLNVGTTFTVELPLESASRASKFDHEDKPVQVNVAA